jgi:hypothetical protein
MKERVLNLPKLLFIVGTRAVLGGGVALLATRTLSEKTRLRAGATMAAIGALTTIPAVLLLKNAKPRSWLHAA